MLKKTLCVLFIAILVLCAACDGGTYSAPADSKNEPSSAAEVSSSPKESRSEPSSAADVSSSKKTSSAQSGSQSDSSAIKDAISYADMPGIKRSILKHYMLTYGTAVSIEEGTTLPFEQAYRYIKYGGVYGTVFNGDKPCEAKVRDELVQYYDSVTNTFKLPAEIADNYILGKFDTVVDHSVIKDYSPSEDAYIFTPLADDFPYDIVLFYPDTVNTDGMEYLIGDRYPNDKSPESGGAVYRYKLKLSLKDGVYRIESASVTPWEAGVRSIHYDGAFKVTWRYVTKEEANLDYEVFEGDHCCGLKDGDGNVILDEIYGDIDFISPDRIYTATVPIKKDGKTVKSVLYIFDAKGNVILQGGYSCIYFIRHSITGEYFPIACGQTIELDSDGIPYGYLLDFDGKRVIDRNISRILCFGNGPTATNPDIIIAVDSETKDRYVIYMDGTITREENGFVVVLTQIRPFLTKFFSVNTQGADLNELSDEQAFQLAVKMMFQNGEYTKNGDEFIFDNAKITGYADIYFQKTQFDFISTDAGFTYDAENNTYHSALEFGLTDDGPQYDVTVEITESVAISARTDLRCRVTKTYEGAEYSKNNTVTDYQMSVLFGNDDVLRVLDIAVVE